MDDLVRWLGEQLDEDERIVREAIRYVDTDWHRDSEENVTLASGMTAAGEQPVAITADRWRRPMIESPGVVAYVAEWDPARVLREIDAKQGILAEHAPRDGRCRVCAAHAHDSWTRFRAPCTTLRLLALPYADRSGYREEWRS